MFEFVLTVFLYVLVHTVTATKLYDPPSNDVEQFRSLVKDAKNIVVITGSGISEVPNHSEAWEHWRNFDPVDLDNMYMFENMPFMVWEFAHYRREFILKAGPTAVHKALADFEQRLRADGQNRNVTIITLNTDGLHGQAGSRRVIEVFGSLFKTQCLKCGDVRENRQQPICPSLQGRGNPSATMDYVQVDEELAPHCTMPGCGGLLRPHILFENENFPKAVINDAEDSLRTADLCLVVGTSSTVHPVAEFAPTLAGRGVPVAEFNKVNTDFTMYFPFQFKGDCKETLPPILQP